MSEFLDISFLVPIQLQIVPYF
jgi:hypothetical protein